MICAPSGSADPMSLLSGVHILCVLLVLAVTEDSVVVYIFKHGSMSTFTPDHILPLQASEGVFPLFSLLKKVSNSLSLVCLTMKS